MHRQALHHVAARRYLPAAATPHLAVDLRNIPGFVRDLGCNSPDWKQGVSRQVVLDCCCYNMAEGEHQCIELGHGLVAVPLLPSQSLAI